MSLRNDGTKHAEQPVPGSSHAGGNAASFWREAFQGIVTPTPLWLDRGSFASPPGSHRVLRHTLADDAAKAVRRDLDTRKHDASVLLAAAWAFLLERYGAEGPVVFAGGDGGDLPLVLKTSPDEDIEAWLARVTVRRDATRRSAPADLDTLRSWLGSPAEHPLWESVVRVGNEAEASPILEGDGAPLVITASSDLTTISVSYDSARFDEWTVDRVAIHLGRVIARFARTPHDKLADVTLLDDAERKLVVQDWNATAVDYQPKATIPELFGQQVAQSPDAVAVVAADGQLTYGELDRRANQLAQRLVRAGVGPDQPVALFLERSLDTIVAMVGILRAGGAYLALEPLYPRERLGFMLDDAEARVVLAHGSLAGLLPPRDGLQVIVLDDAAERAALAGEPETAPSAKVRSHHLAYVTYTSGSTGIPKGVQITHRAVNRLVCSVDYVELGPEHALLQAAPLAFDASTLEVWGALLTGGRVVMHPEPVPTAGGLAEVIQKHGVTTMWLTAALFNAVIDEDPQALRGLKQLLTGGEVLSVAHVRKAMAALPDTQLINGYGPTESTTFTTTHRIPRDLDPTARSVPIGRPIRDTQVLVLDARQQPVPVGIAGELYIGGEGLARGYLKRPELTAEKFVRHPFGKKGERLYRTGDLVRWLPDGTIDFIGRIDTQVKIRGFRIEPGEIESAILKRADVERAAVVPREDTPGFKRLVAYLVVRPGSPAPSTTELREFLERSLPEYMVPSAFMWLPTLPVTPNGKLDTRALPAPGRDRPTLQESYVAPRSDRERALCNAFSRVLDMDGIGARDNFFELGGNSLLALRLLALLRQEHGLQVPPVKFFQFPQPEALARWLDGGEESLSIRRRAAAVGRREARAGGDGIAIIGMAGRFPGARSIEELWDVLCAGRDTVTTFRPDELDPSLEPDLVKDPQYVPARGVIDDVEMFDAAFFGINPKEAEVMDPQQRIFLEVAWEALERAGCCPDSYAGAIGVFGGMYNATYYKNHVATRPDLERAVGEFQTMVANEKDYIASRVAHKLSLTGPAIAIHTACSTSLVAVCQAFESLRSRQCDMALAGGVAVTAPPRSGYLYQEGNMLSPDGHTRTFDADAQGTVFSDGVAMVVLKRLDDAIEDGDTIWAVIRGAAVNNDGGNRASFTAPSVEGQASVIAMAHASSGIDPRTISYVETHGTATPLGDPIEVEGLTQAFRLATQDRGFCGIGSLKSNVGHMVIAAGAGGLIKTALALTHRKLPPTAHFKKPNPKIDFASSPFYVVDRLQEWPSGETPRRAGVSAFGVGGTNAHVVIEEPPAAEPSGPAGPRQLLLLSARSQDGLDAASANLAAHLSAHPEVPLADVAYTLQMGRKAFAYRRAVVASDPADAVAAIERKDPQRVFSRRLSRKAPELAFMFPGQGAQYVNMGRTFYRDEPKFREAMDECVAAFQPVLGRDLKDLLFVDGDSQAAAEAIRATSITQPSLFAIEYSLARLFLHWGLTPTAMIGHSVGEFVCAALAGVMAPADAARLVAHRGALMQALPAGSMLSVRLAADLVRPRLAADLEVASENGPSLCVVSGPTESVARLQATLEGEGVVCRHLHTSHAFHSPMMDPVIEPFAKLVREVSLQAPAIPFVSTVTGTWITPEQATDPMYWARHLRASVRFATGVRALLEGTPRLLLEVGPRATLSTLARQQITDRETQIAVPSLADKTDDNAEWTAVLAAAGQLWLSGISIDWRELHARGRRQRVVLPTYPFERKRFWIDPAPRQVAASAAMPATRIATTAAVASTAACASPIPQPAAAAPAALPVPAAPAIPNAAIPDRPREGANPMATAPTTSSRPERLIPRLAEIFEEVSGIEIDTSDTSATFMELGLDSLALTQVAQQLQRAFSVKVTFRQLMEDCSTLQSLAEHMDKQMPAEPEPVSAPAAAAAPAPTVAANPAAAPAPMPMPASVAPVPMAMPVTAAAPGTMQYVIDQQLALMRHQLALLSGGALSAPAAIAQPPAPVAAPAETAAPAPAASAATAQPTPSPAAAAPAVDDEAHTKYDVKKAFGAIARIHTARAEEMTPTQKARLEAFIRRFTTRTKGSKAYTQANRGHLADPRAVTGFKPIFKELIYPIVSERSAGAKLWDVDGNEYVDVLCGFGSNYFGWQPQFVVDAVKQQIESGYQIGPQHKLAGEVAKLFCDITGHERAAFCNTGSEAVMGCTRVARTVTGRSLIAMFTGAYHGIFDEVIVRGTKKLRSVPAAPGIMPAAAQNILVLDYGTPETLEILRSKADELAAILVEPVQSRRPDLQPAEFLHQLRDLTTQSGTVLVFDEVVCGFRVHPRGAQGHFGIQADLASYGKVIGGGYPIGVIAGKKDYMDALDGGFWQFGDDSFPTVGVTYFAGTFVRHPLALMAAKAVLEHLKTEGPQLQEAMNRKTAAFVEEMNDHFKSVGAPIHIKHFSSIWKPFYTEEQPFGELMFFHMRERGVHILDGFPCFFTTAHSDADIAFVARTFKEVVAELQQSEFLPGTAQRTEVSFDASTPPVPGARLGRDRDGSPAWFVPHPEEAGKFVKVG